MRITCPGCSRALNVPDTAVGKTVRCPACKATVKVEETFSIMPEKPSGYESAARPTPEVPEGLPSAKTCPTCGFLLLPEADHCNRCGTDLATGERREDLVGYQAGLKTKLLGRTGWIVTLAVTGVIVVLAVLVVLRVRGYAARMAEEERRADEAARKDHEVERAPAPAAKPAAEPAAKPVAKPKPPAAPPKEDVAVAFANAFTYLVDASTSAQKDGLVRIADMGAKAVPLVEKKLAECADSGQRDARARKMLARALGRIAEAEASRLLVGLLTDADPGVRAEALEGLAVHGAVAQDALTGALGSDSVPVRASAARATRWLQFPDHTTILLALLGDDSSVAVEAAAALSVRPGTPDVCAALVGAIDKATNPDGDLDVAAAASEALAKHKGAHDLVVKTLTASDATGDVLHSPRTFFLATPLVAWKTPVGLDLLATWLGGGKSTGEVLDYLKKFLDARNPVARVGALKEARLKRLQEPQMVFAASLCLVDSNRFVAKSALQYLSSLSEVGFPLPLVVTLGHEDIEFAISVAAALSRRTDAPPSDDVTGTLKRALAGKLTTGTLQRRIMAAGVLARRGVEGGEVLPALLRGAAFGPHQGPAWDALRPPLSGWAAYHYSFLVERNEEAEGASEEDLATLARRAENSPSNLDRAYYAAAAAKLGKSDSLTNLRGQLTPGAKGFHARLVVRLLGELHAELKEAGLDTDARDALVYQLHRGDPELLVAVVDSLRALGDATVVGAVVERIPQLKPEAATVLREAVVSFGTEAEPHVLELLKHRSPLVRRAAMDCLTEMGEQASKAVVRRLVEILQDSTITRDLRMGVPKVLAAVSGLGEKPAWNWRDWAGACRVRFKDLSERLEYKRMSREWLSIDVPKDWKWYAGKASSRKADGRPEIKARIYSDPPGTPRSRRKYKSERDFRWKRKVEIALVSRAGGGKIRPGLEVEDTGMFYAGKAKMVGMRLVDNKQQRTSYYVFLFAKAAKAYYYAEITFAADSDCYDMYKTLFEKKLPKSVKVDLE